MNIKNNPIWIVILFILVFTFYAPYLDDYSNKKDLKKYEEIYKAKLNHMVLSSRQYRLWLVLYLSNNEKFYLIPRECVKMDSIIDCAYNIKYDSVFKSAYSDTIILTDKNRDYLYCIDNLEYARK